MPLPYNSTVKLFANVPLDPMYEHTILFTSVTAQRNYFDSLLVLSADRFTNLSYIRHTRGTIRLEADMSLLTNCNYLQFYNPSFNPAHTVGYEDVSFYCFIDSIEYVNEKTVEIKYTIDHMQTWMFYYELNPCYVEREHVSDDAVGSNRVIEGLDTGPYICAGLEQILPWNFNDVAFFTIASQAPDGSQNSFQQDNVYGYLYCKFDLTVLSLQQTLESYLSSSSASRSLEPIIAINQFPKQFWSEDAGNLVPRQYQLTLDQTIGFGGFKAYDPKTSTTKTYIPNNNKLYCYPYNFMTFESPDGSSTQLKYEDFKSNDIHKFWLACAVYPQVETVCAPMDYQSSSFSVNLEHALYCKNYPTCGVASDAFQAWWAQNRWSYPIINVYEEAKGAFNTAITKAAGGEYSNAADALKDAMLGPLKAGGSTLINPATSLQLLGKAGQIYSDYSGMSAKQFIHNAIFHDTTANIVGGVMEEIGQQVASYENHKAIPDTMATKANATSIIHSIAADNYKIYYTQIRPEYAKIIDNFFTCFGYAIHEVKIPNITSRTEWNYIKTKGCTLKPNSNSSHFLPMEAERTISAIYDKGITFWHNPLHIHNYSLTNSIVT